MIYDTPTTPEPNSLSERIRAIEAELMELPVSELQFRLNRAILENLQTDPDKKKEVAGIHARAHEEGFHTVRYRQEPPFDAISAKPIDTSIYPLIYDKAGFEQARDETWATNFAKATLLFSIYGYKNNEGEEIIPPNPDLHSYLLNGTEDSWLIDEISRPNPFDPVRSIYRWRMDSFHPLEAHLARDFTVIEGNFGEPQGDDILMRAQRATEASLEIALGLERKERRLGEYPNEQMMEAMVEQYRRLTGDSEAIPVIGYLAWNQGRTSISLREAELTAVEYEQKYGGHSIAFDPREIVDITPSETHSGLYKIVVQNRNGELHELDIVRRLFGEPMENMDLWKELKATNPVAYYKLIGQDHPEFNPDGINIAAQSVNSLNSWGTDKKLDAIIANPELAQRFNLRGLIEAVLTNHELRRALNVPDTLISPDREDPSFTGRVNTDTEVILRYLNHCTVETYPLRKPQEGLFKGDTQPNGMTADKLHSIAQNRREWVIKLGTLIGHSGDGVHVGKGLYCHELPLEVLRQLNDAELAYVLGGTPEEARAELNSVVGSGVMQDDIIQQHHLIDASQSEEAFRGKIKEKVAHLNDDEAYQSILDRAWHLLVTYGVEREDAIVMRAAQNYTVPTLIINPENGELREEMMNVDINGQMINVALKRMIARVSTANKTNVSGGYGGFAVVCTKAEAAAILAEYQILNEN